MLLRCSQALPLPQSKFRLKNFMTFPSSALFTATLFVLMVPFFLFIWDHLDEHRVPREAPRDQFTTTKITKEFAAINSTTTTRDRPLPKVQHLPTPEDPFVFFHIPKSGGSSVREVIFNSAMDLTKTGAFPISQVFIPCYEPKSCVNPPPDFHWASFSHPFRVLAGHFLWGQLDPYLSITNEPYDDNTFEINQQFSCFIMLRHPVDRVESCYYWRFFKQVGIHLADITLDKFSKVMHGFNKEWRTGCNNALLQHMSGFLRLKGINNNASRESAMGRLLYTLSVDHMQNCVVGMLDRWEETVQVVNHWFPWLKHFKLDAQRMNVAKNKPASAAGEDGEHQNQLRKRPDLVGLVEDLNYWEFKAYEYAVTLFEKQLLAIRKWKGGELKQQQE